MLALLLGVATQSPALNLCTVIRKPSEYRHRVIRVAAEVVLAFPHGAYLKDDSCQHAVLRLGKDLPNANASATNLIGDDTFDCSTGPHRPSTPGIFVGKLIYGSDGAPYLRLLSVDHLQITPCPKDATPLIAPHWDKLKLPNN